MSISVHMMSGDVISIHEKFVLVSNLREIISKKKVIPSSRLVFSKFDDDKAMQDYDFVEDGDAVRVFVKDMPTVRVRMSLGDNCVICIRTKKGTLIDYYGYKVYNYMGISDALENRIDVDLDAYNVILEVDLDREGYDVMREEINKDSPEDVEIEDNKDVFGIFFERFMRFNVAKIVHV